MKKLFYLSIISILLSCSEKAEVVTGKLENFISDEVSFERNLETGIMRFYTSVEYGGKESVYTYVNDVFQFFDSKTGWLIGSFKIPKEGPLSLKGGVFDVLALPGNQIVAYSEFGHVNFYSDEKILKTSQLQMAKIGPEKPISLRTNKMKLLQISDNSFEILNDPFDIMASSKGDPGFDLNFSAWLAQFYEDGNWLCISDFQSPYDESFQNNISSGALNRIMDSESQSSWIQFPFSDSLYQVKECKIVNRLQLEAKTTINYKPDIIKKNGGKTTWNRPEDGSINLHLLQDKKQL